MAVVEWISEQHQRKMKEPSYLDILGLDRHPFPVAPDDEHFYVSEPIEHLVAEIVHGIEARKGFMVISGDVGLGKTTVTRRILHILAQKHINTSFVFHTSLKDVDLLREINRDFGLDEEDPEGMETGLGDELQRLNAFLLSQYRQGRNSAIIIDDAQNLDRSSLELVRMISNLEADHRKLVQILLVGQPELSAKLDLPELRQLKSRIFINKAVRPLNKEELRTYVVFKLSLAGNQGRITLMEAAFRHLYRLTGGNFRQVNMLMDRCLYVLCRDGDSQIGPRTVKIAHADLNPRQRRVAGRRLLVLAASVVLPVLLAIAGWTLHLYSSRGATAAGHASPTNDRVHADVVSENMTVVSTPENRNTPDEFDPAVTAFLKSSGLEAFTAEFELARKKGALSLWAEHLYQRSGRQLVQLPDISETVRRTYGALELPSVAGNGSTWCLFWQPKLTIKRFYYDYQSEEIARLQQLLATTGFYRLRIDGIVGTGLMKALNAFQAQSGLPVTGFPDPETLFVLYHQPEGRS